ncbi:MAG TPA: hypothetical protein VMG32_09765 [Anaeromyxobacteraceae bacterium]|nr:hypothetical protein [Anaeromyxobacteraceae bacterium]
MTDKHHTPDGSAPGGRSDKLMQTFRMPRDLVEFLKSEAARGSRDLTAQVFHWLDGIRCYFGLPEAATSLLERDRQLLGMERFEYLLHTLYHRSLQLREQGPGFDAPRTARPGERENGSAASLEASAPVAEMLE